MSASPWDGSSRRALPVAIAVVAAADVIAVMVALLGVQPGRLSHPEAPRLLLALGSNPAALAPIALVALTALAFFAAGKRSFVAGLVALAALGTMVEAHAALIGGPMRVLFHSGVVLLGWMFGLAVAKVQERRGGAPLDRARIAEFSALGALAATYLSAATSKLIIDGEAWVDPAHLQGIIASHSRVDSATLRSLYANAVVEHGWLAWLLSVLTLIIQFGAPFALIGPRARMVWALGALAFHLNVWLLTHIPFPQASALVALLCFPWPRLVARIRKQPRPEIAIEVEPPLATGTVLVGAGLGVAPLLLAFALSVPSYTALHHRPGGDGGKSGSGVNLAGREASAADRALLAGLADGELLADWRVDTVRIAEGGELVVHLVRGELRWAVQVTDQRERKHPPPRRTERHHIFYSLDARARAEISKNELAEVLDQIAERVVGSEGALGAGGQ